MYANLYGNSTTWQVLYMLQDLKLGQYTKIPPRWTFAAQMTGSIVGSIFNYTMMKSIISSNRAVLQDPTGTRLWSGWIIQSYNSASIAMGALGKELFTYGKAYWLVLQSLDRRVQSSNTSSSGSFPSPSSSASSFPSPSGSQAVSASPVAGSSVLVTLRTPPSSCSTSATYPTRSTASGGLALSSVSRRSGGRASTVRNGSRSTTILRPPRSTVARRLSSSFSCVILFLPIHCRVLTETFRASPCSVQVGMLSTSPTGGATLTRLSSLLTVAHLHNRVHDLRSACTSCSIVFLLGDSLSEMLDYAHYYISIHSSLYAHLK